MILSSRVVRLILRSVAAVVACGVAIGVAVSLWASKFVATLLFGVQALFNIGVVLGIVPNKGITLPLVSYGGSSLVITMFLVGLLLNVGRRPERHAKRAAEKRDPSARKRRVRVRVITAPS